MNQDLKHFKEVSLTRNKNNRSLKLDCSKDSHFRLGTLEEGIQIQTRQHEATDGRRENQLLKMTQLIQFNPIQYLISNRMVIFRMLKIIKHTLVLVWEGLEQLEIM